LGLFEKRQEIHADKEVLYETHETAHGRAGGGSVEGRAWEETLLALPAREYTSQQ